MIRFFPVFPSGAPGAALLLMRAATAAALLLSVYNGLLPATWSAVIAILPAAALLAGLFTRAIGAVGTILLGILAEQAGGLAGAYLALHGVQALALTLLGAGAYSIDARLFGRRVIRLDDRRDTFG